MIGGAGTLQPPDAGRQVLQCGSIPIVLARLAAVLGELLELGDPALAFDPRRVVGGQRLDQAADPVADLEREVGGGGAGEGADVLGGHLAGAAEQLGVLGLAHRLAPDLRQLGELVDLRLLSHLDRLLVSDHPDVVVEGAGRVVRVARLDVEQVPAQRRRKRTGVVGEQQRPPGAGGRERRRGGGVERARRCGRRRSRGRGR